MKKVKRIAAALMAALLTAGCLAGCGGSQESESSKGGESKQGGTLVVGIPQDPQSFNPDAKSDRIFSAV